MAKEFLGTVVSTKMTGAVVVTVDRVFQHPKYRKIMIRKSRFKAQSIGQDLHAGDGVRIIQVKPVSKGINFKVIAKI